MTQTKSPDVAADVSRRSFLRAIGVSAVAATAFSYAGSSALASTPSGTVDVREFGARGDGVTDDSRAIMAALASGATRVTFSPGTYIVRLQLYVPWTVSHIDIQPGASLVKTTTRPMLRRAGTVDPVPRRVSGARNGASVVSVPSTAGIAVGSWVYLASDDVLKADKSKRGALRKVVASTPQTLTLDRALNSDLIANPRLHPCVLAPALTISGGGSLSFATPRKTLGNAIRYDYALDPVIQGVEVSNCGDSGIVMQSTVGGLIDANIHDCVDEAAIGCYGYGVEVQSGTRDLVVAGSMTRVRHAFTTNSAWGHMVPSLELTGEPENIVVRPVVRDTTSAGIDTHEAGYNIVITPDIANPGTKEGFGINVRCRDVHIVGGSIAGARDIGIFVKECAKGTTVTGTSISNVLARSAPRPEGISCKSGTTINGVRVTGMQNGTGVTVNAGTPVTVTGSVVDGQGRPGATALRVGGRDGYYAMSSIGCPQGVRELTTARSNVYVIATRDPVVMSRGSGSHTTTTSP